MKKAEKLKFQILKNDFWPLSSGFENSGSTVGACKYFPKKLNWRKKILDYLKICFIADDFTKKIVKLSRKRANLVDFGGQNFAKFRTPNFAKLILQF